MSGSRTALAQALAKEAREVRGAIDSKRSDRMLRLFDFLVERAITALPPRESDIVEAIFTYPPDSSQGATVRVYVHRLRKKLDHYYAGRSGPRLLIPLGGYCIMLADPDAAATGLADAPDAGQAPPRSLRRWAIAAALVTVAAANAAFAFHAMSRPVPPPGPIAASALWSPIARSGRPDVVVIGDTYLFAELDSRRAVARMIRDPSINSREDLDVYLMRHHQELGRLIDLDLHHVAAGSTTALRDIWPIMHELAAPSARSAPLVPASQLTPDLMKSSDIVYVGPLGALRPLLRDPLFQASGFRVGQTFDELIDKQSSAHFASDGAALTDDKMPREDYGYIASLPGPAGNHILFVSGLREPAVQQMAQLARDPAGLKMLHERFGGHGKAFEALFRVRTLGAVSLDSTLLIARPLRAGQIWDRPTPNQRFPGDTYETGLDQ